MYTFQEQTAKKHTVKEAIDQAMAVVKDKYPKYHVHPKIMDRFNTNYGALTTLITVQHFSNIVEDIVESVNAQVYWNS